MAIIEVRTRRLICPLHSPFRTALRETNHLETLVVEVIDADGRSGFGEAPQVWRVTGESMASAEAAVAEVCRDRLLGRDPDDLNLLLRQVRDVVPGNNNAKSAVDVALHDLVARRLGLPLARLLGGGTLEVPTDITVSADTAAALAVSARARMEEGFEVLKLKVGTGDATADVDRVRAVRDAVGRRPRIRLDANQGWTPKVAVRAIQAIEDAGLDVELVEQPVPAPDLAGLAWVTDRVDTPILADESVFSVRDLIEVIRRRAADLVNIKLAKCGGLAPARTLLELAAAAGLGTMVGSMMEGPVGVAAAASLVAAYPTTVTSDLDAAWWLASSPTRVGIRYSGGMVRLPDAPGLGLEFDW
ncbi:MAG TPA: dipeptide epimerase [Micromonosporaceae bacterium]|nr:dipeptide epimerase [Micromonosporaceae bacterium]